MISACVRGGTEVTRRLPRAQALSFNPPSRYDSGPPSRGVASARSVGFPPPLAVVNPKVVQATGRFHDCIGGLILGGSQHVLDDAAALDARQRVLHPHPDAA